MRSHKKNSSESQKPANLPQTARPLENQTGSAATWKVWCEHFVRCWSNKKIKWPKGWNASGETVILPLWASHWRTADNSKNRGSTSGKSESRRSFVPDKVAWKRARLQTFVTRWVLNVNWILWIVARPQSESEFSTERTESVLLWHGGTQSWDIRRPPLGQTRVSSKTFQYRSNSAGQLDREKPLILRKWTHGFRPE